MKYREAIQFLFFAFLLGLFLIWPAYLNGFPLVFSDTAQYIHGGTSFRPIGYSFFIADFSLGKSLWLVILSQSLLTSILLLRIPWLLFEGTAFKALGSFLVGLLMVIFTDAAQYASWLMPDISTSWLFLGSILFFLSHRSYDRYIAFFGIGAAMAFHSANILIVFISVPFFCLTVILFKIKNVEFMKKFKMFLKIILFAFLFIVALNFLFRHKYGLFPPKNERFVFARFTSYGFLSQALDEYCPQVCNLMCSHKNDIKKADGQDVEWILWSNNSPMRKFKVYSYTKEISDLTWIMLTHNFKEILRRSLNNTIMLLLCLNIDDDYSLRVAKNCEWVFKHSYISEQRYFLESRQYEGFPVQTRFLPLGDKFFKLSILGFILILFILLIKSRSRQFMCMSAVLLLFLVINALVNASLSGVFGRYHMRVLWLMPYLAIVMMVSFLIKSKVNLSFKRVRQER